MSEFDLDPILESNFDLEPISEYPPAVSRTNERATRSSQRRIEPHLQRRRRSHSRSSKNSLEQSVARPFKPCPSQGTSGGFIGISNRPDAKSAVFEICKNVKQEHGDRLNPNIIICFAAGRYHMDRHVVNDALAECLPSADFALLGWNSESIQCSQPENGLPGSSKCVGMREQDDYAIALLFLQVHGLSARSFCYFDTPRSRANMHVIVDKASAEIEAAACRLFIAVSINGTTPNFSSLFKSGIRAACVSMRPNNDAISTEQRQHALAWTELICGDCGVSGIDMLGDKNVRLSVLCGRAEDRWENRPSFEDKVDIFQDRIYEELDLQGANHIALIGLVCRARTKDSKFGYEDDFDILERRFHNIPIMSCHIYGSFLPSECGVGDEMQSFCSIWILVTRLKNAPQGLQTKITVGIE